MIEFLAFFGFIALASIVVGLLIAACEIVKERIYEAKRRYRYKHRFDKPPTAKCYCFDCTRHDNKTGRCYKFERWHTADAWFCWDAEPREVLEDD